MLGWGGGGGIHSWNDAMDKKGLSKASSIWREAGKGMPKPSRLEAMLTRTGSRGFGSAEFGNQLFD